MSLYETSHVIQSCDTEVDVLVKAQFGRSRCAFVHLRACSQLFTVVSCSSPLPHTEMIHIDSSVPSSLKSASSCTAHVPGHEVASLIVIRITRQENLRTVAER